MLFRSACIPLAVALALEGKGFEDEVDILKYDGWHIFRDDLLYLMAIPLEDVPRAITSHKYTMEGYDSLYCELDEKEIQQHFEWMVVPILITRMEVGI